MMVWGEMMPAEDKENSDFTRENGWVNIGKKYLKPLSCPWFLGVFYPDNYE
jgi:hypothetical protein